MVATRRGVRVSSPTKTNSEQPSDVQDTPSTGRRTRRAAKLEETLAQHTLAEPCSKFEKSEIETLPSNPTSTKKRCTRASRLHSPEQPCTPVDSTHEADMSDLESCCSVVSDPEPPATCARQRRQSRARNRADEEISEVDSCSSAVSGSKPGYSARRSTRRKMAPAKAGVDLTLETESCSSVVSESQRVTRSQRKTARTRPTGKQHTEDSELSDADSCTSGASRRRSRRQLRPIPLHLDELSESSQSPVRTRAARGKAATAVDVSEPPSCESEGFECGPTYGLTTLRRGRSRSAGPKAVELDSEATDVHSSVGSPGSTRGRGTPCSSRTGSGTSSRGAPASRRSVKDCSVVLENTEVSEDNSLNDSRLESTVIAEDADCTLLKESEIERSEEQEGTIDTIEDTIHLTSSEANTENIEKEITVISEENSHVGPSVSVCPEDTSEPAVIAVDQQEVPSTESNDRDASEMEMLQETVPPSEPSGPCPLVTVTICEKASEMTEETEEEQEAADAHLSETDVRLDEDAVVETRLDDEEKMEVGVLKTEVQHVVDASAAQAVPIQVTSIQQHKVAADAESEEPPKDVIIQRAKTISLLDSSDDEEEFDKEASDVSEDLEPRDEETAGPSNKSEAAAASVDGLFMIDTRPGQEADEDYYREGQEEEAGQEEDEEFVDEEADDEDEDEDAKILFSSRDSHSKELSSRIDPGIRMKELGGLYISFDGSKSKPVSSSLQKLKEKKIQDEVMKKSVIGPDFEKKDAVPPYSESKQALKLKHRAEREKSTGDGWFNMKAPEMSQELKGDLQVLKMRGSLDPKKFYKKNDRDGFPKYFQFGTVVDSPVDFYHSRIPKKERKRTMVEELLADAEFRHQNKKRFQHIMTEKAAQGAGKRNKKKNKFHKT